MTKYEIAERIRDLAVYDADEIIDQIYALASKVENDIECSHEWKFFKNIVIDPPYERHIYKCTKCGEAITEEINVYGM